MKKTTLWAFITLIFQLNAQQQNCQFIKTHHNHSINNTTFAEAINTSQISHESKYDITFAHLNLNLEKNTKVISGNVVLIAKSVTSNLDTFMCSLYKNYTIDSVKFNSIITSYSTKDSSLKIIPTSIVANSQSFTVAIFYHGTAPTFAGAYVNGYELGSLSQPNSQMSWTFGEPWYSYHWWPCKQVVTDKLDSTKFFITTDSNNVALSNGVLKNVVTIGNKKRYEWHNNNPIAFYLVAAAVSKFRIYNIYAKPMYLSGDSILIQNFIPETYFTTSAFLTVEKLILDKTPKQIELFSKLYGMYPFYKQKYGHFRGSVNVGGMENQTISFVQNFNFELIAHELSHQWWGNNVTCKGWKNIFIHESFATYSEFIVKEYLDSSNYASYLNTYHNSVFSNAIGKIEITGSDTLDDNKIFSNEVYLKGGVILNTLRFVTNNDSLWFNTLRTFQALYKNGNASVDDFKNYYHSYTGIDPTQFFNQWFYGAGYPTFDVKWFKQGNNLILKSTQTVSTPTSVALFKTPMEYKIIRTGFADTTVRVNHFNIIETYTINLAGTIDSIIVDQKNWVLNRTLGPVIDSTLIYAGVSELSSIGSTIKIYPNPCDDHVNIENENGLPLGKIKIIDLIGRELFEMNSLKNSEQLELSEYDSGIYFLEVNDCRKKIIID